MARPTASSFLRCKCIVGDEIDGSDSRFVFPPSLDVLLLVDWISITGHLNVQEN